MGSSAYHPLKQQFVVDCFSEGDRAKDARPGENVFSFFFKYKMNFALKYHTENQAFGLWLWHAPIDLHGCIFQVEPSVKLCIAATACVQTSLAAIVQFSWAAGVLKPWLNHLYILPL